MREVYKSTGSNTNGHRWTNVVGFAKLIGGVTEDSRNTSQPPDAPTQWRQQGIGVGWQRRFFYWLIRIGGKRPAYHWAYMASFWYVLFYPSIRRRCRHYLARRFPEHRGILRRFLDTFRLVRTFSATLIDAILPQILGPDSVTLTSPDHDRLMELAAGENGLILLHAHVGSWQASLPSLKNYSKRVSVLRIPEPLDAANAVPPSVGLIDPRSGLAGVIEMTDALLGGQIVSMMGDRTFGDEQNVASVQFLGGAVRLPITAYRLASATGAPVLVVVVPRVAECRYEFRLAGVIAVPPGLGRDAQSYTPYAQSYIDCIARFTGQYPWQFFNFFDLWQDRT